MAKRNTQVSAKTTSKDVATEAAKLLAGARTSGRVRSVAGSALAQRAPRPASKAKKGRGVRSFKAGKDL